MAVNGTEDVEPPTPLFSDYIEMAYLSFVIIVGIPLNVVILRRLLVQLKKSARDSVKSGFLLLQINLNISDILLLIMAFGKFIWLYTYEWKFGDIPCRVYQFLSMFALYVSSNIVVCIAVDRLRNVIYANKMQRSHKHVNPVKLILCISWIFAFVCSVPQFFFFQTVNVAPDWPDGWYQCTDIWKIFGPKGGPFPESVMTETAQDAYNISHLIIVFWGPAAVMLIAYLFIATKLMQYSLQGVQAHKDSVKKVHLDEESSVIVPMANDALLLDPQPEKNLWGKFKNTPIVNYARRHSRITLPSISRRPSAVQVNTPKVPAWRRQLRSKVFRTTFLVVIAHIVFWFPYNSIALMKYINEPWYQNLSENANVFKDMQILITLINPFLYGFS